jgi:hypothetical protein
MNEKSLVEALEKLGARIPVGGIPESALAREGIPAGLEDAAAAWMEPLSEEEIAERLIKLVGVMQCFEADQEDVFPPSDPSTARRNGGIVVADGMRHAVNEMLDAEQGYDLMESTREEILTAFKTADSGYFLMLAQAAEHVRNMDSKNVFQKIVDATRRADADLILAQGKIPTAGEIKRSVIRRLGPIVPGEGESSRWTEIFKAAGIQGKRRREGAKKKHGE